MKRIPTEKEYHCKDCYYFTYWNAHTKEEGFGTCCADGFSDPCNGNDLSCNLFDLDEEKVSNERRTWICNL